MRHLVLLRHGQSTWNKENRFTGWMDVPLSEKGVDEAREAGRRLVASGFAAGPDRVSVAFTSLQKRAIKTLWLALEEMDLMWIPVRRSWRLNERHYGELTGLDKSETAARHGEEQVKLWRRSYDIRPPEYAVGDERNPALDPRYADLGAARPRGECLKDVVERMLPYWESDIAPALSRGERVLVAAHGNSLRALVMHLDQLSKEEVLALNIPTGIPLVYELDDELTPVSSRYLADEKELAEAVHSVAAQGKAKS